MCQNKKEKATDVAASVASGNTWVVGTTLYCPYYNTGGCLNVKTFNNNL